MCYDERLCASGGGCVLVVAREGRDAEVREAARELGEIIDFEIDVEGLVVSAE